MYIGELIDDKKDGFGVFKYLNGDRYEGSWKNDTKHGNGTFKWDDG